MDAMASILLPGCIPLCIIISLVLWVLGSFLHFHERISLCKLAPCVPFLTGYFKSRREIGGLLQLVGGAAVAVRCRGGSALSCRSENAPRGV